MKKKGIIIAAAVATGTVVIAGAALITLTAGGVIGSLAIKSGKLSLFNKGNGNYQVAGLPANTTFVTPGPTDTQWDTPMEFAINVPDSIFKGKDGTVIGGNTDNHTIWINTYCGAVPGPLGDNWKYYQTDNYADSRVDHPSLINMGNGHAVFTDINESGLKTGIVPFMREKGESDSVYLGTDIVALNRYGDYNDPSEMPLVFIGDRAFFIAFSGIDYSKQMLPGNAANIKAKQAEKVYLGILNPEAENTDEDPCVELKEIEGASLTIAGNSYENSTDRIKISTDGGLIYIMNYVYDTNKAFVLYIYDPEKDTIESRECVLSFDSEMMKPLIDNGFIVEDGVLYMVYNNDYYEKKSEDKYNYDYYVEMGVFSFNIETGETKKNDEFGFKRYQITELEYEDIYDRRYKGALCKNNDGIFFENRDGIVLRRKGESSAETVFKNSSYSLAERYDDPFDQMSPECAVWNVADGWIYYSDWDERGFDHKDKSTYHPEDFIINRVNYNTGEEQSFSIFPLLLYGEFAEQTSDPNETHADWEYDVLEFRFICGIAGNSSVIHSAGYMEYIEINDDGSWVLYYYDVTVHEVKTFEFDKTKQYEIP